MPQDHGLVSALRTLSKHYVRTIIIIIIIVIMIMVIIMSLFINFDKSTYQKLQFKVELARIFNRHLQYQKLSKNVKLRIFSRTRN